MDFAEEGNFRSPFRCCEVALVCQRVVSQLRNTLRNGGAVATFSLMVCTLKDFKVWRFRSHFAAVKWVYGASKWYSCAKKWFRSCETPCGIGLWLRKVGVFTLWDFAVVSQLQNEGHCAAKWHSCAKKWFRSCKIPCEMELWLRNWEFSCFGASQSFRRCEMGAPVLRSGTRVPKSVSQLRKFSQRNQLSCEIGFAKDDRFRRDTLIPQRLLLGCETVSQRSANFAEAVKSRKPLFLPCFCPVFALFLLRFCSESLPFNFFAFSPTWDHSKRLNYIKIHNLRSRIKIKSMDKTLKFTKFTKILDFCETKSIKPLFA